MQPKNREQCNATICFPDATGRYECRFRCQRVAGHPADLLHRSEGVLKIWNQDNFYQVEWNDAD